MCLCFFFGSLIAWSFERILKTTNVWVELWQERSRRTHPLYSKIGGKTRLEKQMNEEEYKKRMRQSHLRLQFNLTNIYKKYKKLEENGGSGILVNLDSSKPFSMPPYKASNKRAQKRFVAMEENFSKTVLSAPCNDKVGLTDSETLRQSKKRDQKFNEYLVKYGEDAIINLAPEEELQSCANEDYRPVADGIEDSFAKIFEEIDARRQPEPQEEDGPPQKKRSRTM